MGHSQSPTNRIGQTVGGRYQIEEILGQGGMSTVYKATDPNLRRTVAVKLIHPHLSSDKEFVRRFEQEAAAVAQLRHPHIIQVYDFNHDDDLYYMVLEYVPGQTLQQELETLDADNRQLTLEQTGHIMATTCDAVAYAHGRGMIHRDLKPANVMLNPKGEPILMDFGVAKMLGASSHTATGAIIGTAKYMSPEQARGEHPDERTDIYSLGVMLFEMITGDPPFDANSTVALLMKHVTEPVPDLREINQDVPKSLVEVVEKALAKDRTNRFQNATEMAAAIRATYQSAQTEVFDGGATVLQAASPAKTSVSAPEVESKPAPAKSGGMPVWLLGAGAALLILLLGVAAFFMFSGSTDETGEGQAVAAAGDTALPSSEGMTRIPAAPYPVGVEEASGDSYAPARTVELEEYWIDQYETTNAEFAAFVADTGHEAPSDWSGTQPPADQEQHPVDGVNWASAVAYCEWAGKRLPSEAEWEVAARGTEGRLYPWGNNRDVVPLPQGGTYPVGDKPTNQSPFGVFDMAGNVWEWVGDSFAHAPALEGNKVLRGGANGFLQNMAYRLQGDPNTATMIATAGFRCAASQVDQIEVELAEDVLAADNFADPGSGWPILTEGTFLYGYHPPDYYHVQVNTSDDYSVVTRDPALADFTVQTDVNVFSAETAEGNFRYGLAIRRAAPDQYYALAVSPRASTWHVLKSSAAGLETLVEGTLDEPLRGLAPQGFTAEETDNLRIDAQGSEFLFHINGQPVAHISDSDYGSGEIGFFVENYEETLSHVHFDDFTIREVDFDDSLAASLPGQAPEEQSEAAPEPEEAATEEAAISDSDAVPAPAPETAEPTEEAPAPETAEPTEERPTSTPAPPSPTPLPEDMVFIPAGTFLMGSTDGEANELPEHEVTLDPYLIDEHEVTNEAYRECVAEGVCTEPSTEDSFTRSGYFTDSAFADYPVVAVTWDQALTYCQWAGKRLPTEAEWEYAASGPDNLTWPWGNQFDPALSAASSDDTEAVGSFPQGASPFGVQDMAGNVAEWVQDVFNEDFYANSPARNPVSTGSGVGRIYRGGSFGNPDGAFFTTSRRYGNTRSFNEVDVGFRCAKDAS